MIIAIWGRDGTGKSTLADALGMLFIKQGVTAIIDTDLTQPTLPIRVNGKRFSVDSSLGKALSGVGTDYAARYLHQHPKNKQLFYAGLTDRDEYLSYEHGLETAEAAKTFVEQCASLADTVILDLSGQRTDPFVPAALSSADKIIVPITPNVQGICWMEAVKPFLEAMYSAERVLPVTTMAERSVLDAIEKAADIQFAEALPYVREFRQNGLDTCSTPTAIRYFKQVQKLYKKLTEVST
jgi:MinD-like ATPase involved in chromosome partitioning or flagellar assembly